jgi:hypothetical protein
MSPAAKSKRLRRNSTWLRRDAAPSEDDAEQALKEIAATEAKLADRRHDNIKISPRKRMKGHP